LTSNIVHDMLRVMTNNIVGEVGDAIEENSVGDSACPRVDDIARDLVNERVSDLAQALAHTLIARHEDGQDQREWLARLAALTAIRSAADDLAAHAAAQAAEHGAGYPALGLAAGTTRQNARVKWPGLVPTTARK
jgi:hypothetical protein